MQTVKILVSVATVFSVKWLLTANIFIPRVWDKLKDLSAEHGAFKASIGTDSLFLAILAYVIIFPLIEECVFRKPALEIYQRGKKLFKCLGFMVLLNLAWIACHVFNKIEFADGHSILLPIETLVSIGLGGVLYGLAMLWTKSFIPPVAIHMLWNLSVIFPEIGSRLIEIFTITA